MFYASINAGSLISTFASPILREDVVCFDREDCFFVAFLVPCVLMFISVVSKLQNWIIKSFNFNGFRSRLILFFGF